MQPRPGPADTRDMTRPRRGLRRRRRVVRVADPTRAATAASAGAASRRVYQPPSPLDETAADWLRRELFEAGLSTPGRRSRARTGAVQGEPVPLSRGHDASAASISSAATGGPSR